MDELTDRDIVLVELGKLLFEAMNLEKELNYNSTNNKLQSLKNEFGKDNIEINQILETTQNSMYKNNIQKEKIKHNHIIFNNIFERIKNVINERIIIKEQKEIIDIFSELLLNEFPKIFNFCEEIDFFELDIEIIVAQNIIKRINNSIEKMNDCKNKCKNYQEQLNIFTIPLIDKLNLQKEYMQKILNKYLIQKDNL